MLKKFLKIFAVLLILVGLVWILQGLNILLGSFMSGNPQWSINGFITAIIGVVIFLLANRK
ncbi:MAG: hypothetical protein UZ14_CFX002002744 [Chloroflexi bacterium OLB14]|nr:MAG: hypothetical protein UZ14_CFX002002744 [Chloroflexi bacterium OLB14]